MTVASPQIVQELRVQIDNMVQTAKKTANPWDDALAGFLQMIVGKPTVEK
jgi:hypothetical protein